MMPLHFKESYYSHIILTVYKTKNWPTINTHHSLYVVSFWEKQPGPCFFFALWSLECGGHSGRDALPESEFVDLFSIPPLINSLSNL